MKLIKTNQIGLFFNGLLLDLAVPANLSYSRCIGSSLALCLVVQLTTGILLAERYVGDIELAFSTIDHIMRDVFYGWLLRYLHALTASLFLTLTYLHIGRGLYYGSYIPPRQMLWFSGFIIFICLMATAFLGYTLPFGSMSLRGAVVITNLLSALPVIGTELVNWIWGGFSVSSPTLTRFYAFHYLLPFVIASLTLVHLILLHENGSNNPLGLGASKIKFSPYLWFKDIVYWLFMAIVISFFLFYEPDYWGHPDNFNSADPLVTPSSIVPEFYFLPYYAILRAIPNKLGGVVAMVSAIFILLTISRTSTKKPKSSKWKSLQGFLFWSFTANFIFLGWLGNHPASEPYILLAEISTLFYFIYFIQLTLIN